MRLKLIMLSLFACNMLFAQEIEEYIDIYKSIGVSDYNKEQSIINKYKFNTLKTGLNQYFSDSVASVRQKAYYLIYKKGITAEATNRTETVNTLINGCFDKNGGVVGAVLSNLNDFNSSDFDNKAKSAINKLLNKKKMFHRKKLAMLAGNIGAGKEAMQKKLLDKRVSNDTKWAYSLALARQGSAKHINYCMNQISEIPVNNNLITYIIPDLVYTKQREMIDYCISLVFRDTKDCFSPNPDKPEYILCAYRVLELIAPVIADFPYQTDATGTLNTDDYDKALTVARKWLTDNPNYNIIQ